MAANVGTLYYNISAILQICKFVILDPFFETNPLRAQIVNIFSSGVFQTSFLPTLQFPTLHPPYTTIFPFH